MHFMRFRRSFPERHAAHAVSGNGATRREPRGLVLLPAQQLRTVFGWFFLRCWTHFFCGEHMAPNENGCEATCTCTVRSRNVQNYQWPCPVSCTDCRKKSYKGTTLQHTVNCPCFPYTPRNVWSQIYGTDYHPLARQGIQRSFTGEQKNQLGLWREVSTVMLHRQRIRKRGRSAADLATNVGEAFLVGQRDDLTIRLYLHWVSEEVPLQRFHLFWCESFPVFFSYLVH